MINWVIKMIMGLILFIKGVRAFFIVTTFLIMVFMIGIFGYLIYDEIAPGDATIQIDLNQKNGDWILQLNNTKQFKNKMTFQGKYLIEKIEPYDGILIKKPEIRITFLHNTPSTNGKPRRFRFHINVGDNHLLSRNLRNKILKIWHQRDHYQMTITPLSNCNWTFYPTAHSGDTIYYCSLQDKNALEILYQLKLVQLKQ